MPRMTQACIDIILLKTTLARKNSSYKYPCFQSPELLTCVRAYSRNTETGLKFQLPNLIQRPGTESVVRESAYHVIGLNTPSLWVTLTSIPVPHSCKGRNFNCTSGFLALCRTNVRKGEIQKFSPLVFMNPSRPLKLNSSMQRTSNLKCFVAFCRNYCLTSDQFVGVSDDCVTGYFDVILLEKSSKKKAFAFIVRLYYIQLQAYHDLRNSIFIFLNRELFGLRKINVLKLTTFRPKKMPCVGKFAS